MPAPIRSPYRPGATAAVLAFLLTLFSLPALATPAAAQSAGDTFVRAKSTLVGVPAPCIDVMRVGRGEVVEADCQTQSTTPNWCLGHHPNATVDCKAYDGNVWRDAPVSLDTVRAYVHASNADGRLRAETGLIVETRSRASSAPGFNSGYLADAYSQWSDRLDLGVPPVGGWSEGTKVEFTFWAHGLMGIVANRIETPSSVEHGITSRLRWGFDMKPQDGTRSGFDGTIELKSTGSGATRFQERGVDSLVVLTQALAGSERFLDFRYYLHTDLFVPPGGGYDVMQQVLSARAWGFFGHTAGVAGVRILDANDNDITASTPFTFLNGTRFVSPSSTVPEPSTWALLGTGVLALAGATRRRASGRARRSPA